MDYATKKAYAIEKLCDQYKDFNLRVQKIAQGKEMYLAVHLPTKIQTDPKSIGGSISTERNIADIVAATARSIAKQCDLKAEIDGPQLCAGGIYVSWIRLEDLAR